MLAEQHALVDVCLHLPLVDGVRLGDVDEDGVRASLEAPVDLLDVAGPATKRRSGEAAEDEQERVVHDERAEPDGCSITERDRRQIREEVADGEPFGTPMARDRRDDDLALAGLEALGICAVTRIEPLEARIDAHATYRVRAAATRSTSSSLVVVANGSASARSNASSAPGKSPRSRYAERRWSA